MENFYIKTQRRTEFTNLKDAPLLAMNEPEKSIISAPLLAEINTPTKHPLSNPNQESKTGGFQN